MPRRTRLNETGYQVGSNVRVERGLSLNAAGHVDRDHSEPVWIVSKKVDVKDDPETTYDYRYEEVARFSETEVGECPDKAFERADALAQGD